MWQHACLLCFMSLSLLHLTVCWKNLPFLLWMSLGHQRSSSNVRTCISKNTINRTLKCCGAFEFSWEKKKKNTDNIGTIFTMVRVNTQATSRNSVFTKTMPSFTVCQSLKAVLIFYLFLIFSAVAFHKSFPQFATSWNWVTHVFCSWSSCGKCGGAGGYFSNRLPLGWPENTSPLSWNFFQGKFNHASNNSHDIFLKQKTKQNRSDIFWHVSTSDTVTKMLPCYFGWDEAAK